MHRETGPDVVIVSEAEYLQFRRYAGERLQAVMDRIGAKAEQRGMTEEKLDVMLADES